MIPVSFDEFLAMFRSDESPESDDDDNDAPPDKKRVSSNKVCVSLLTSLKQFSVNTFDEDNDRERIGTSGISGIGNDDVEGSIDEKDLVGIDAVIPGGKYDSLRDEEA